MQILYIITINDELTVAGFEQKNLAEQFVKAYNSFHEKQLAKLESKIEAIYEEYSLQTYYGMHEEIFKHLVDTDFIESHHIKEYETVIEQIETFKDNMKIIGFIRKTY